MTIAMEVRQLMAEREALELRIQELQQSPEYHTEVKFETELRNLLGEYNYSLPDVIKILEVDAPQFVTPPAKKPRAPETKPRRPRRPSIYLNPHTGERRECGNVRAATMADWTEKYGVSTVAGWRVKA